jgi:cytochrome c-type biogenesis protein CcmH/NrfG
MYVRSYYLLGQIALERGDLEAAREHYQRFLDYWASGDLDRDRVAQAKRVVG